MQRLFASLSEKDRQRYAAMEKAKTSTGLKVTVDILAGIYVTGKKVAAGFLENMRIVFDEFLSRWNYRAIPQPI
ncbi:MAG: hypothetical protein PHE55_02675 [Methylococcaceae bacterium]|nr:hypothetical protein [Methylococcaceae bacterium]